MFYHYECEHCGKITEIQCSISEMKRSIQCSCGKTAKKVIEAPTLVGVSSTKKRINEEAKRKNVEAGHKQHGSHISARTGRM